MEIFRLLGRHERQSCRYCPLRPGCNGRNQKLADAAKQNIIDGKLVVFAGPLYDQTSAERVPAGQALTDKDLLSIDWFVKGVDGQINK